MFKQTTDMPPVINLIAGLFLKDELVNSSEPVCEQRSEFFYIIALNAFKYAAVELSIDVRESENNKVRVRLAMGNDTLHSFTTHMNVKKPKGMKDVIASLHENISSILSVQKAISSVVALKLLFPDVDNVGTYSSNHEIFVANVEIGTSRCFIKIKCSSHGHLTLKAIGFPLPGMNMAARLVEVLDEFSYSAFDFSSPYDAELKIDNRYLDHANKKPTTTYNMDFSACLSLKGIERIFEIIWC